MTRVDYERYYNNRPCEDDNKYEWAASEVFDLCTYDGDLDELFVRKIFEVLKVIFDRSNYEYIKNEDNYITYILVCQVLERFGWIDWGTSIRGAWFNSYQSKARPILEEFDITRLVNGEWKIDKYEKIPCTEKNLKALIAFVESPVKLEEKRK